MLLENQFGVHGKIAGRGNMKKLLIFLVVLGLIGGGSWYVANKPGKQAPTMNNDVSQTQPKAEKMQVTNDSSGNYVDYSIDFLDKYADKRKVLFFHAGWCPTCRTAEKEIINRGDELPEDMVIVKVDYDKAKELKDKYVVTYQHTFVLVDDAGEKIIKWGGGGVDLIKEKLEV